MAPAQTQPTRMIVGPHHLEGLLGSPASPKGLVIFAHGSGSGRFSPRNNHVARRLEHEGFATLLLDLLSSEEEADRRNVFDIELLASRLVEATEWARATPEIARLPIGFFGASTGGGAALVAAAMDPEHVSAVVSRGGRPDLAGNALSSVEAPTLLLVGSRDEHVLELNRWAMQNMRCTVELSIVPGASHLFEELGTLDEVVARATRWFGTYLNAGDRNPVELPFPNRRAAGRLLAGQLLKFKDAHPLILALPRGGVPVAYEVAERLNADLDLLLVRKLGAPHHPEFGIGAVIDGDNPQILINRDVVGQLAVPSGYIHNEAHRQFREIERRREQYLGGRKPIPVTGRTVIVVDDGIATGSTVRAALRAIRQKNPAKLILAVPVGAPDSLLSLNSECDEVVCLITPDPFHAVGAHYDDFTQTTDEEVKRLLDDRAIQLAEAE
ncbi:phosphoribosyltransferase [Sphingomonas sp.]|uniref:phosphoribosyltransferase n=1 Tax=Sphingomonas sp. TaxID=28214 RepID=UPI00286D4D71|nr:phosphoribosyltransferase [Sphingomonas sp.]